MKLILIFVFFSLGTLILLAKEIPHHDMTEATTSVNDDRSVAYRGISLKRRFCTGRWRKVNSSPVCFGAKNGQFGKFYVPKSGKLAAIKLVHLYGYVSCFATVTSYWSYWGCGDNTWHDLNVKVNVVITTSANRMLLPPNQFITHSAKWSKIPGYNSLSPELILSVFSDPHQVNSSQELRLWYGEDLMDWTDTNNGGRVCCDVYALYV